MRGFLHGRMPQRIPSLEYKSFTNSCHLPRFTTREKKSQVTDEKWRLCGDSLGNVQHILSGCSALAQSKYLQRHNNAFKILFFEVLRSLDVITKVEPWLSQVTPKPLYENEHATAFWDVPLLADTTQVKANRIDATVIVTNNS